MKKLGILTIFFIMLDQIIKLIISANIPLNSSIQIIKNFFNIANVHNDGAAWSILSNSRILLIIVGFIALIVIYMIFIKGKKLSKSDIILYSMLIGGIIGNLLDRIIYGFVIDYLDFNIFGYDYPIFNLADTLIVLAAIGIIIKTFKEEKNAKIHN